MISIRKLLKEMDEDKNSNIASIEDPREWKIVDGEHLLNMKFEREGDSVFIMDNPALKVYKMKQGNFILEEPMENHEIIDVKKGMQPPMKPSGLSAFKTSKGIRKYEFESFIKLINFFDNYKQDL
jgi:hypothetical protein